LIHRNAGMGEDTGRHNRHRRVPGGRTMHKDRRYPHMCSSLGCRIHNLRSYRHTRHLPPRTDCTSDNDHRYRRIGLLRVRIAGIPDKAAVGNSPLPVDHNNIRTVGSRRRSGRFHMSGRVSTRSRHRSGPRPRPEGAQWKRRDPLRFLATPAGVTSPGPANGQWRRICLRPQNLPPRDER